MRQSIFVLAASAAGLALLPVVPAATAMQAKPERPRATPVGNPASWFPADAYPPQARNAGQEGRTVFSLDIDAQGRVMQCNIVQSSGSELLDTTTCDLAVVNGRFSPARDAQGMAVAGVWNSAMRWQLVTGAGAVEDDTP